jgi:hypothetical protein
MLRALALLLYPLSFLRIDEGGCIASALVKRLPLFYLSSSLLAINTMQENSFDVIVVGLGGHGSSTLAYLAKNHPNLRVLGIEQFSVTHKNGISST